MASAVLRDMQVRWLQGEEVAVTEMVSVENVFNRTAAALGTTAKAEGHNRHQLIPSEGEGIERRQNPATWG